MMWYLTSDIDPRIIYIVPQSNEVIVGRSADAEICNFAIPDDPSLSRKHVNLSLENGNLFLTDLNSRYGTFVNSEKAEPNVRIQLHCNDIVKFGKLNSVWKVQGMNIVTCTSTLKGENLQSFKLVLSKLGGTLKNEWDPSCVYLTMPVITLTIKVVLALVQCAHIVTTDFWIKCLESVNKHEKLPDTKNFLPQIVESILNKEMVSFMPDPRRATLFEGKRFVFFSRRQFEMYKTVLQNGAAEPLLLSECKMTKSSLCEDNVIVIQYNITTTSQETEMQRNQINDINNYLKTKNKRIVADAEIGLAVLYCSLTKYCNPDFSFTAEMVKQTSEPNRATEVLVQETEEIIDIKKENVIIDESLVSNDNASTTSNRVSSKRKSIDDFDISVTNKSKKFAVENVNTSANNSKRKLAAEETSANPTKKFATDNNIDENEDFFNFDNTNKECNNKQGEKKLILSKPLKRKADTSINEEDLFNFVETTDKNCSDSSIAKLDVSRNIKKDKVEVSTKIDNRARDTKTEDISAMRGTKLDELKKMNLNYITSNLKQNIKQESNYELDEKMKELNIGLTVVKIKKELIVKKEPVVIEELGSQLKNFKKFKKVWPVKMQVTIIPRSSISVATNGGSEVSVTGDEKTI